MCWPITGHWMRSTAWGPCHHKMRVPFAGRVPIDPSVAACEDQGKNFFVEHPESETLQAILDVADQLISKTTTNDQSGAV